MSIGKYADNPKVTFITLALCSMMLAELVLAEKALSKSSKPGGASPKSQQIARASAAPKVQPARGVTVSLSKPRIGLSTSRSASGISISRITKSSIGQPSSVISSHRPSSPTFSRTPTLRFQSSFGAPRASSNNISTGMSSSMGNRPIISLGSRPSSSETLRIGSSVSKKQPFATITRNPTAPSLNNLLSQNKTSRIGSLINKQKTSVPIVAKSPAADQSRGISSGNRISSIITSRLGSFLGQKKPATPSVRKQPLTSQSIRISSGKTQPAEAGQHLGSLIGKEKTTIPIIRRLTRVSEPKQNTAQTSQSSSSGALRTLQSIDKKSAEMRAEADRTRKSMNLRVVDRLQPSSRPKKTIPDNRAPIINSNVIHGAGKVGEGPRSAGTHTPTHGIGTVPSRHVGPSSVALRRVEHRDYQPGVRYIHRHEHVYWDHYNRLCHRIVWPRYRFMVYYNWGPCLTFRYVYPYHLRRYIFVSLGGYWPLGYNYLRYYWYGCHPYWWYGYYPIAREVTGDTCNYYTYNYYYGDDGTASSASAQVIDGIRPVDHNTFADVREKLAQQKAQEPEPETLADTYFDEAVKAFEAGNYNIAIEKFAKAMELAPDDMVLPFAYAQAFFANEQYSEAVKVLREALAKVSPEKEGVFYPRGLYSDDDILFEQIERLTKKAETFSFDADLQLLLGYQLLGIGEIDKAVEPLQQASQDLENADAATILLDLLAKISPASGGQGTDAEAKDTDL